MKALRALLRLRHDNRTAIHWEVTCTDIVDVKIMTISCAWKQCGVLHVELTDRCVEIHKQKHLSQFVDNFGNAITKEMISPRILHYLFEHFPLVDKQNEQHQSALSLERKWRVVDLGF